MVQTTTGRRSPWVAALPITYNPTLVATIVQGKGGFAQTKLQSMQASTHAPQRCALKNPESYSSSILVQNQIFYAIQYTSLATDWELL
jgi:hypothetical protein